MLSRLYGKATGVEPVRRAAAEPGFLFACVAERLKAHGGLALPSFENYRTAHSKAGFSRLLSSLRLPMQALLGLASRGGTCAISCAKLFAWRGAGNPMPEAWRKTGGNGSAQGGAA